MLLLWENRPRDAGLQMHAKAKEAEKRDWELRTESPPRVKARMGNSQTPKQHVTL